MGFLTLSTPVPQRQDDRARDLYHGIPVTLRILARGRHAHSLFRDLQARWKRCIEDRTGRICQGQQVVSAGLSTVWRSFVYPNLSNEYLAMLIHRSYIWNG